MMNGHHCKSLEIRSIYGPAVWNHWKHSTSPLDAPVEVLCGDTSVQRRLLVNTQRLHAVPPTFGERQPVQLIN